jgi:hypothetical protein
MTVCASIKPARSQGLSCGLHNRFGHFGQLIDFENRLHLSEHPSSGLLGTAARGSDLVDYWRVRLGKAERLILETLAQAYPDGLNKEDIAARAGYEANGAVSTMRSVG